MAGAQVSQKSIDPNDRVETAIAPAPLPVQFTAGGPVAALQAEIAARMTAENPSPLAFQIRLHKAEAVIQAFSRAAGLVILGFAIVAVMLILR
ncbi:MAG: hypothetical protein U5J78_07645 [Parasphingorhabdus sp.]|nr:hypothetical protein [Parasphingorhabdus sp.]